MYGIGVCEDVAAGGYWIAAAADEIFANPASVIGSIGVVSAGFGLTKRLPSLVLTGGFIPLVMPK